MDANQMLEAASWVDTLLTIGQVALCVGCPTAGITYLVARAVVKGAAKVAAKRWLLAGAAGATATIAASLLSGGGGEGSGDGPQVYSGVQFSAEELSLASADVVVLLDAQDHPYYRVADKDVANADELRLQVLVQVMAGKLRRVSFRSELPEGHSGNWILRGREVLGEVAAISGQLAVDTEESPR